MVWVGSGILIGYSHTHRQFRNPTHRIIDNVVRIEKNCPTGYTILHVHIMQL